MNRRAAPLIVTLLLLPLLAACSHTPTTPAHCNALQATPQPDWIASHQPLPGYASGIGTAAIGSDLNASRAAARTSALSDLAQNIATHISSEITIIRQQGGSASRETTHSEILNTLRARSDLGLEAIEVADQWTDRATCQLWLRLKVPEAQVATARARQLARYTWQAAEANYQRASDTTLPLGDRQQAIGQARRQLATIEFHHLPDQSATAAQQRYQQLEQQLQQQSDANALVILLHPPSPLPIASQNELITRLSHGSRATHLTTLECDTPHHCLQRVKPLNARRLLLLTTKTETQPSQMGSQHATLTLSATLYDVASQRLLYHLAPQSGRLLTFNRDNLPWSQAIDRLMQQQAIGQLQQHLITCQQERC
jgi:hypothetical protein